jgi:hypothetical protein
VRNVEAIVEANVEAVNLTNKGVEAIEPILTTLAGKKSKKYSIKHYLSLFFNYLPIH